MMSLPPGFTMRAISRMAAGGDSTWWRTHVGEDVVHGPVFQGQGFRLADSVVDGAALAEFSSHLLEHGFGAIDGDDAEPAPEKPLCDEARSGADVGGKLSGTTPAASNAFSRTASEKKPLSHAVPLRGHCFKVVSAAGHFPCSNPSRNSPRIRAVSPVSRWQSSSFSLR